MMFYDDPNTRPEEGMNPNETPDTNESAMENSVYGTAESVNQYAAQSAGEGANANPSEPEQGHISGEYHYTRHTNPGTQQETPSGAQRYNESGGYGTNQNGYQSGGYGGNQNGYQGGGYGGNQNGYQNGYAANSGTYQGASSGSYSGGGAHDNARGQQREKRRSTVPPRPATPPTPPKTPKKSGGAGKIVALALVCSLVGGLVGAGGVYALRGVSFGSGSATVSISDRGEAGDVSLTTQTVKAGEAMTPAQIYKAYGDAVVCINMTTRQGAGAGTGFIIDGKEGYVMTCYHVVDGARSISVTLNDSTSYSATYVGGDKERDCAIIKIVPNEGEKLNLKSVVLGDSTKLEVGESVCTIGNALGTLANTLTSGTVSALDRSESMDDGTVMNVLQTDTSINSGNSGGPLFNEYGEVIGIVNSKRSSNAFSNTASVEGIAFAIPISDVTEVMSDLMEHGYITGRPLLGVKLATITQATAQQYPDMVPGAYVREVSEGSCAEKAGMKVGDIITSFDGKEVASSAEVIELKRAHKAGDEVDIVVHRDGDDVQLKVKLDEDEAPESPIDDGSQEQQPSGGGDYGYGFNFGGEDDDQDGGYGFGFGGWPFGW